MQDRRLCCNDARCKGAHELLTRLHVKSNRTLSTYLPIRSTRGIKRPVIFFPNLPDVLLQTTPDAVSLPNIPSITMSSSSKPLKNSKAARAPTASPGTPPSSPIMQPSNSSKPAVPSSASWGPVVLHQTAPRGQRVADPPQVPPPPTMTVEQFVDLLKLAVGSNTAPTSSSSAAAAPADVTTVPPSGSAKKRASKLTYCSVKEV